MQGLRTANSRLSKAHGSHKAADHPSSAPAAAPAGPLQASVLVLNRMYMAVHVVNVRRAFSLLCRDLAEVVHCEDGRFANYDFEAWRALSEMRCERKQAHEDWIRSVNFEILVPRVVRLLTFDRVPKQQLHLSRRNVLARDGHICQYCGRHFPTIQLSLDHVLPRSRGGGTTWENVVCACLVCNVKKGGRTPREAHMKLVRRPAKPARNPWLVLKLANPKYESWRTWLEGVQWEVGARD